LADACRASRNEVSGNEEKRARGSAPPSEPIRFYSRSSRRGSQATTRARVGRRPATQDMLPRRSCYEPCHAGLKCHHSVRIPADRNSAPGGIRTHTKRILRTRHSDHCGLYQRLCHHRIPHQPHQQATVDVISCHEPCHASRDHGGMRRGRGGAEKGERRQRSLDL
jgi:hypothetical protein